LSHDALMNIRADKLATEAAKMKKTKTPILKTTIIVTAKHSTMLQNSFQSIKMRNYLMFTQNWSTPTIDGIWWEIHDKVLESLQSNELIIIQKYIHERLACNYKNNKYYPYKTKECSICLDKIEHQDHILQCKKCTDRTKIRDVYL
jgi:hypothetical protein